MNLDEAMADPATLTPQEKLAISRQALFRVMTQGPRHQSEPAPGESASDPAQRAPVEEGSAFSAMRYALHAWWRHHPAHAVLDVGRPMFDRYAARRPFQVLGIAMLAGAAAVLFRPWRLVSIGGLLLAAVKSASTPGVLLSMLTSSSDHPTKKP